MCVFSRYVFLGLPVAVRGTSGSVGRDGRGEGVAPEPRAVAGSVVGEDSLDTDAVLAKSGVGSLPERDGGHGLFVGVDLEVDEAGGVIKGGMHKPVAG